MSNAAIKSEPEANELNGSVNPDKRKEWVKFEDESPPSTVPPDTALPRTVSLGVGASTSAPSEPPAAAVLKTESVHINLERGDKHVEPITLGTLSKNVEFVNVRQGFCKYTSYHYNYI